MAAEFAQRPPAGRARQEPDPAHDRPDGEPPEDRLQPAQPGVEQALREDRSQTETDRGGHGEGEAERPGVVHRGEPSSWTAAARPPASARQRPLVEARAPAPGAACPITSASPPAGRAGPGPRARSSRSCVPRTARRPQFGRHGIADQSEHTVPSAVSPRGNHRTIDTADGADGGESVDWTARPAARGATGAGLGHGRNTTGILYPTKQRVHHAPTIIDYVNIRWVDDWCKRCNICIEICPKDSLVLTHDAIIEVEDCIRCGLCERYCPDLAIEVLPEATATGAVGEAAGEPVGPARPAPRAGDSTAARPRKTAAGRGPWPGRSGDRPHPRHHRPRERPPGRSRQPDVGARTNGQATGPGERGRPPRRRPGGSVVLRRVPHQPLERDPGGSLVLTLSITPNSGSSSARTRSRAPTRSSGRAWPARRASPPPPARASASCRRPWATRTRSASPPSS